MYNGYPLSIVIIYYEALAVEVSIKQLKKIREIVHTSNNYFIYKHTKICLINNVLDNNLSKEINIIPSKDRCISTIWCSNGYSASEIIELMIGQQLDDVKHVKNVLRTKVKLLPLQVVAIQYEESMKKVNENMFTDYKKYLQISNFTLSYRIGNASNNKGGMDLLHKYVQKLFNEKISKIIAEEISSIESDIPLEQQKFFLLE